MNSCGVLFVFAYGLNVHTWICLILEAAGYQWLKAGRTCCFTVLLNFVVIRFIFSPNLGCYLGSTSYVRKGEPTVNTVSTPFLLVRYFRVFRFRCDGSVQMVTSAQDPQDIIRIMSAIDHNGCLTQLPHSNMNYIIAFGHYSVVDSMVKLHISTLFYNFLFSRFLLT